MRTALTIPPGIVSDDTSFDTDGGGWKAGSRVRFWRGRAQVIGGWEAVLTDALDGVCRGHFAWTINSELTIAAGTHAGLEVYSGGVLTDITPDVPPVTLDGPFDTTNGSPTVTVTYPSHGATTGTVVTFTGASAVGGITITGDYTLTVADEDTFTITHGSNASSDAVGGGTVTAQLNLTLPEGNIDGTGGAGYGTGGYGVGGYSEPSTADYWPRTWSFGGWGSYLLASPRGGSIFAWPADINERAEAIPEAPANVTWMLVATKQRQVLAFGCNEVSSGTFNPLCIRTSDAEDYESWVPDPSNLSDEVILPGSGRIVSARNIGEYLAVWTDGGLFLGTFLGDPAQPWRFDPVGEDCGLIGPLAATVRGMTAYWITPSGQFMAYTLGGEPQIMLSPVRDEFFDNLASAQQDKIVATTVAAFGEVWWFYPDSRDGLEVSRAVSVSLTHDPACWMTHELARTSFIDVDPSPYPIGISYDGHIYWHEKGHGADGGALTWYLESADQYLNEGQDRLLVRGMWPDFQDQLGPVWLSIITRDEAQGAETTRGPYALAPETTRKDFFVEGRLARVRIEGNSAPSYMRLGKPVFDVEKTGQW